MQPTCEDRTEMLQYLRFSLQNTSLSSCEDAKHWCTDVSFSWRDSLRGQVSKGTMTRMICPRTCGCDDPKSDLFIVAGCPAFCSVRLHAPYKAALTASMCKDTPISEQNSSRWKSWVRQARAFAQATNSSRDIKIARALEIVRLQGCTQVYELVDNVNVGLNPCFTGYPGKTNGDLRPFRGLAHTCPESCPCAYQASYYRDCPPACADE